MTLLIFLFRNYVGEEKPFLLFLHSRNELRDDLGVRDGRQVTKRVILTDGDLAENATHYLSGSSFWETDDDHDLMVNEL